MEENQTSGRAQLGSPRAIVVGRESELESLTDLARRAQTTGGQSVFISGDAGIGKSTLVAHFLRLITADGWNAATGQCIEYADRAIPFGPILNIIRTVLSQAGDSAAELLGNRRADLASLLPEWRDDELEGSSLTGDVDRLIDALSIVLKRAGERQPLVVVIEDIHWADAATRDLVASLIHALKATPVLMVVTERTSAVPRGHALKTWLAEQQRFGNVHLMTVRGLSNEALAEQAANILGVAPDADLIADLAARTGGNAYYANELLHAKHAGSDALPASLADFLTSRIEGLDDDEQHILRTLAVAGAPMAHRLLDATLPNVDIGPAIRKLFNASILVAEGDRYTFHHALMREAILRGLLPFETEELHRQIAEALTNDPSHGTSPADLAMLALHWAGANDPVQSLAASLAAGRASARVGAFEQAAALALETLQAWPRVGAAAAITETTQDRVTIDAADWLAASNQSDVAATLLSEAIQSPWAEDLPDGRRALLRAKLAPLRFQSGQPEAAQTLLDVAVDLVQEEVSPEAAQVHHRVAGIAVLRGAIQPALAAAERAIDIARQIGPDVVLVEATTTKALGLGVTVGMEAGIELVREARRMAMAKNLVSQAATTYKTEMFIVVFNEGRTQRSIDIMKEGLAFADQRCGPSLRIDLQHALALGLVEAGQLREAEPLLDSLMERPSESLRGLGVLQTLALHRLLAGRLEEADSVLATARDIANRFSAQEYGFQCRLEAELARRQERYSDAHRLIDHALRLQSDSDNITFIRESVLERCRLARAVMAVDPEWGTDLVASTNELVDDLHTDDPAIAPLIEVMHLELRCAIGQATAEEAKDIADRLGTTGFGADAIQTRLVHIELLQKETPDPATMSEALIDLRGVAASSGMLWLSPDTNQTATKAATYVDLDLTQTTEPETVIDVSEPDHGLTPREVDVLRLLAEGMTNKEIGAELFVSHRTVSTHVSNLLAKLHLKNRSEAAATFHRLGLADRPN